MSSSTTLATLPRHSIRATTRSIGVVVAILILAIWAGIGFSLVASRQHAIDEAGSESRNLMLACREQTASILRGVEAEMDLITRQMQREGSRFDLYAWGRESVLVLPGLVQATIVDPDGIVRSTTMDPHPKPTYLGDRAHFRIHLDGKFHGVFIGQSIVSRLSGRPGVPVSRRVEAADGTFLGVLIFLLSPNEVTSLHKLIDIGPHGVITIFGLDNILRARFSADSPDGTNGIGKSVAGAQRPANIAENGEGRYVRLSPLDGISRVFSYGRVGSYPLVVTVGLELDQELASWRSSAEIIVGLTLAITVLLVGLTAYLVRHMHREARLASAAEAQITHTAEHDFLTGLPNRLLLDDRIGRAIAAAQRHQTRLAVLFLDLDGFKHVNDSLGHPVGDKLLQSIANRLVACVRGSDTVCRLGGDEFVVLLPEVQRPEDAGIAAQKMLQVVAEPHSIDGHELCISTSIGASVYPEHGLDAQTLLKNADIALYQAKESGRQCYRLFRQGGDAPAAEGNFAGGDLRLAS